MHAGGGTNDRGEKRNVLIVGVLLLIGSNLALQQGILSFFLVLGITHELLGFLDERECPRQAAGDCRGTTKVMARVRVKVPLYNVHSTWMR